MRNVIGVLITVLVKCEVVVIHYYIIYSSLGVYLAQPKVLFLFSKFLSNVLLASVAPTIQAADIDHNTLKGNIKHDKETALYDSLTLDQVRGWEISNSCSILRLCSRLR